MECRCARHALLIHYTVMYSNANDSQPPIRVPNSTVPRAMPRVRLLIADDNLVLQATLKDLLEKVTASVIVGQVDNVSALYVAMQDNAPDIVLLDWQLPGTPDELLLKRLHEINPRVRVIVLDTGAEAKPGMSSRYADAFVYKDESAQHLFTVLAEYSMQFIAQ